MWSNVAANHILNEGAIMNRFIHNQRGATAIEYAFIIAVVVLVALVGITVLGGSSTNQINNVSTSVGNVLRP